MLYEQMTFELTSLKQMSFALTTLVQMT